MAEAKLRTYDIVGGVVCDGKLSDCLRFPLTPTLSLYVPKADAEPGFYETFGGGQIQVAWDDPEKETGAREIRFEGKTVYKSRL